MTETISEPAAGPDPGGARGRGTRGHHRVGLRHGVSTVTAGTRTALGIVFHDAA